MGVVSTTPILALKGDQTTTKGHEDSSTTPKIGLGGPLAKMGVAAPLPCGPATPIYIYIYIYILKPQNNKKKIKKKYGNHVSQF
jgi:hypothetical protein